jgi:putative oxidoreductase
VFGLFSSEERMERLEDTGLLLLRAGAGALMLTHGWPKLVGFGAKMSTFPDPLGVGVVPTLVVAVFAEFFCSLLLIVGLYTRIASLPLVLTMMVAAFIEHAGDTFGEKEKALLFGVMFLAIACAGPGRFSIDHVFRKKL